MNFYKDLFLFRRSILPKTVSAHQALQNTKPFPLAPLTLFNKVLQLSNVILYFFSPNECPIFNVFTVMHKLI